MRAGIHFKVMVLLTLVILPVVIATGYLPFKNERDFLLTQGRHRANDLMRSMEVLSADALLGKDLDTLHQFMRRTYYEEKEVLKIVVNDAFGHPVRVMGPRSVEEGADRETFRRPITRGRELLGEVILEYDLASARHNLDRTTRLVILSVIDALLCLGFVLHLALKYLVTRRLDSLTRVAERLARGELGITTEFSGNDELSRLTRSFNTMSQSLATSRDELDQANRELEERVRKRTEQVTEEKRRSETIVASLPDGLITFDGERRLTAMNEAASRFLGIPVPDALGKHCYEVIRSEICVKDCLHFRARQRADVVREEEVSFSTPRGPTPVSFVSSLVHGPEGVTGGVETFRDISELRALNDRLRHTERLSAVGTLAAGVAHELNNPLGNISTFAQLIKERSELDRTFVDRCLDNILSETSRSSRIIQQLLDFSRHASTETRPMDLNTVAEEALELVSLSFNRKGLYIVERHFPAPSPRALADPKQVLQVLINLITNAFQATPPGKRIAVEVQPGAVLRGDRHYVVVSVHDTGAGIPDELKDRIFDPFFTTKEVGQGTGLGLTVSYRIVTDLGGFLEFDSRPGEGTEFRVLLRRHEEAG